MREVSVSSATRDCLKLIAVTLNAPDDWNDHKQMLDYGFANYKWKRPVKKGDYMKAVPLMGAEYDKILLYAGEGVELAAKSGDVIKVVYDVPNFVQAPVFNGQRIGSAQVLLSGKVIKTINLIAAEDIAPTNEDRYKKTYFYISGNFSGCLDKNKKGITVVKWMKCVFRNIFPFAAYHHEEKRRN
jgi:D-alanyl-D-alanine carboxypeptidase